MRYVVPILLAVGLLLGVYIVYSVAPGCNGDYEFALGGDRYVLFNCKQAPAPQSTGKSGPLANFDVIQNFVMPANDQILVKVRISEEECAALCMAASFRSFKCRSFDYIKAQSFCNLSSATRLNVPLRPNGGFDHYTPKQ